MRENLIRTFVMFDATGLLQWQRAQIAQDRTLARIARDGDTLADLEVEESLSIDLFVKEWLASREIARA